jgi:heme exporter protein D
MRWESWSEFLAMGGHAEFVWGSFGVTALVIVGELLALRSRRKALRDLAASDDDEDAPPAGRSTAR